MHILATLAAIISAIAIWYWRLHTAANAAKGLSDGIESAALGFRRWGWRRKGRVDLMGEIGDPRIAATVLMVTLAQSDSLMTEAEKDAIKSSIKRYFATNEQACSTLLSEALFIAKDSEDLLACFRRLKPLFLAKLQDHEKLQLLDMLETVFEASSDTRTQSQRHHLNEVARLLELQS